MGKARKTRNRAGKPKTQALRTRAEPHVYGMRYDGNTAAILTWRVAGQPGESTFYWRLITTEGRVVVIWPAPVPAAARLPAVPDVIDSVFAAARDIILWAHGGYRIPGDPEEPDDLDIAGKTYEAIAKTAQDRWPAALAEIRKEAQAADPAEWESGFRRKLSQEAAKRDPKAFAGADTAKRRKLTDKYIKRMPPDERPGVGG